MKLWHSLGVLTLVSCRCFAENADNLPAQPIGRQDLIAVSVYGAPEFCKTTRISDRGDLQLPMLKRPVDALGLLPAELQAAIASELEAEKLLVRPSVTVTVAEYRSRSVNIIGEVRKPVTFQQLGPVTLSEAITRAEGLMPDAADELVIVRAPGRDGISHVERVGVTGILNGTHGSRDIQLYAGDEVRVPVAEKIFVVGNIHKPGAYRPDDAGKATVMSMLAVSEGLLPYANKTAYVYRKGESGREELQVSLSQILQRKAPDFPLHPGDIFYVPDRKGRRLTLSVLDRMINFGVGTTSGILIWRR